LELLPDMLKVIFTSMLPYLELRGAIPLAWQLGFSAPFAFILAVLGNMIPVIPIMLLIGPLSRKMDRISFVRRFLKGIFIRCRKHQKEVIKYGFWGLALFVAIPLPLTGAWSGAVIAFLMGLRKRIAVTSIFLGVIIAGLIVTVATYGLAHLLRR